MSKSAFVLAIAVASAVTLLVAHFVIALPHSATPPGGASPTLSGATLLPEPPPAVSATTSASASAAPAPATATAVQAIPAPPASPPITAFEKAGMALQGALVNIICITPPNSPFHSISATGVLIAPKGYILTSAHVAAYLLLSDQHITCTIRTGNPARPAYTAGLAYIPATWVQENAHVLTDAAPLGTGEHDFALIAITGSVTSEGPPTYFPFVPLGSVPPPIGTPAVIGSYGAQNLSLAQIESALAPTIVAGSVKHLFTFGTSSIDMLELGGSAAAQEGSSGGGVLGLDGFLLGSITTSTATGDFSTRSLSAISTPYIRREFRFETGMTLDTLLALPPATALANFAFHTPILETKILTTARI